MAGHLQLVTTRDSIPDCRVCGKRPHRLVFQSIVDGWTTILTDWKWICQSGHFTTAQVPDMTVNTREMPPGQTTMGSVTTLPRIFGEG